MKHNDFPKETAAVIIPTYNERQNIKKLIDAIVVTVPKTAIIVVDDNSRDQTGKKVKKLQKKYKNLHLIERVGKLGRGSAVMEGFSYALKNTAAEVFIEMDSDFSHNPSALKSMLSKVNKKTVVIGSRYLPEGRVYGWPLRRRLLSKFANLFIRSMLKLPASDVTNGYRAYSRQAVKELLQHTFLTNGFVLLSESLVLLYKKGYTITETPIIFVNRKAGASKTTPRELMISLVGVITILFDKDNNNR